MIHPTQVSINSVTPEMIGRAYKCYDFSSKQNFYQVESSDFANNEVEYKCTYSKEKGFQCSCKSGQHGFANTKHGYCSHVAIAVAAAKEERAAFAHIAIEQAVEIVQQSAPAHVGVIAGKAATPGQLDRIMNATPAKASVKPQSSKAFSLLR